MNVCEPLTAADKSDWLPLWRGYLAFYKAKESSEVTDITFGRLTTGTEPMGGFMVRSPTGEALGIVHWIQHRSCWTVGDYCYLQDLFVSPESRNTGVGRQLIERVYALASARQCARVYWLTHETNTDAMKLYDRVAERSGFVQYRKLL